MTRGRFGKRTVRQKDGSAKGRFGKKDGSAKRRGRFGKRTVRQKDRSTKRTVRQKGRFDKKKWTIRQKVGSARKYLAKGRAGKAKNHTTAKRVEKTALWDDVTTIPALTLVTFDTAVGKEK